MGFSKDMLSTDAVTTGALQCFCADIAAAMSIQYINRPPIKLPKTFVSLGRTISVIMVKLSKDFLASILKVCAKVAGTKNFLPGNDLSADNSLVAFTFATPDSDSSQEYRN
jgi:hypothetical protein